MSKISDDPPEWSEDIDYRNNTFIPNEVLENLNNYSESIGLSLCEFLSGVSSNIRGPRTIKQWQSEVHALAKEKGWYDSRRTETEFLMLIASEIFEALEEVRNHKPGIYFNPENPEKPEGVAVELADCVIRCLDYFEYRGWDLQDIIEKKHKFNLGREFRHGGKKL